MRKNGLAGASSMYSNRRYSNLNKEIESNLSLMLNNVKAKCFLLIMLERLYKKTNKYIVACTLAFTLFGVNAGYSPVVELDLKAGNKRGIARIGSLIPIYSDDSFLTYTSIFSMKDTISGLEGNLGLGIRKMINNNYILGIYSFGDIRRSLNKQKSIFQANIGAELFFEHLEIRMNAYLPLSRDVLLDNIGTDIYSNYDAGSNKTLETRTSQDRYEVLLKGYDIDIGGNIPNYTQLKAYGGFYHFFNSGISLVGAKFRAEYGIKHWLYVGGEVNYDTRRKWSNYADVKVKYSLDKTTHNSPLTNLQKKMTLLPVRDVDIVTQDVVRDDELYRKESEGKTLYFVTGDERELMDKKINVSGNTVVFLNNEQGPSGIYADDELANIVLVNSSGKTQSLLQDDSTINSKAQEQLKDIVLKKGLYISSAKSKNPTFKSVVKYINKDISINTIRKARNTGNIKSRDMVDDGVSISKLQRSGVALSDMLIEGIKPRILKDAGISTRDILNTRAVSVSQLRSDGFTVRELKDGGATLAQLIPTASVRELLAGGFNVRNLRDENVSVRDLRLANASLADIAPTATPLQLLDGGFTEAELLTRFDALTIVRNGGSLDALRQAGVNSRQLEELRDRGELTVRQMLDNGNYSVQNLVDDPTINLDTLQRAGVPVDDLRGLDGVDNARLLGEGGYPIAQVLADGTTLRDLVITNGISPRTLLNQHPVDVDTMLGAGGLTVPELLDRGINPIELKATGRENILRELIDAHIGVRDLLNPLSGGFTIDEIAADPRITSQALVDANVPLADLKDAHYTAKQLWDAGVRHEALEDADYQYQDILNSGVELSDLIADGVMPLDLQAVPGIRAINLYNANATIESLLDAGYNLKDDLQRPEGVSTINMVKRLMKETNESLTEAQVVDILVTRGGLGGASVNRKIEAYNVWANNQNLTRDLGDRLPLITP